MELESGGNGKRTTAFSECFARDGEWKIAGMHMHMRGRAEIADACDRLPGRCDKIQLVAQPPTIGCYHDRHVEHDGRWRFQTRYRSMRYRGPFEMAAAFVDSPDYGPFPGAPGDEEPT